MNNLDQFNFHEKQETEKLQEHSEQFIQRTDGKILERINNFREFYKTVFMSEQRKGDREFPVLNVEITFTDNVSGKSIKFNDLLPMGWKISLSGDSLDRINVFPVPEGLPQVNFVGSFDGYRECAKLGNEIKTVHYNDLESNRSFNENMVFQDLTALLHEIGHANQENSDLEREKNRKFDDIRNFIRTSRITQRSSLISNSNINEYIPVNPGFFGVFNEIQHPDGNVEFRNYDELVYIPRQLAEVFVNRIALIEKDASRYAIEQIHVLRSKGINIEGARTMEEVYQFCIVALQTYNRSYSAFLRRNITTFTDEFELDRIINTS